jgi:hypothetical protein
MYIYIYIYIYVYIYLYFSITYGSSRSLSHAPSKVHGYPTPGAGTDSPWLDGFDHTVRAGMWIVIFVCMICEYIYIYACIYVYEHTFLCVYVYIYIYVFMDSPLLDGFDHIVRPVNLWIDVLI